MASSIQKGHLTVSTSSTAASSSSLLSSTTSSSIPTSNVGGTVSVGRGETEEFVHFLFREGFLIKGSRMESYDFHSITPSLSYLIQKNSENPINSCHTIISAHSSLALKKQGHSFHGKNFNLISKSNAISENIDTNSHKISTSADSKPLQIEVPKQFKDWRAHDIGIGFLLYGETACFVLARMIELAYARVTNSGLVTCCVFNSNSNYLENESCNLNVGSATPSLNTDTCSNNDEICVNQMAPKCGLVTEYPIGVPFNVFILNPYLEVGEIQVIINLEVNNSNSVKQVFACRPDLIELGMSNFELSTKTPCFLLAVKCSIDLTLPIYVYKRNVESKCCTLKVIKEGNIVIGKNFQLSIEILMSFYTWLKSHLLNPKSPFFDLDYGKFYYTRALELLSNIEYIVKVSGGIEKNISTIGGNVNLNDVGLGICGGGGGLSRHFGISKLGTPNSRCSISTVASTNTPVSIGETHNDLVTQNGNLCIKGVMSGNGTPIQGGISANNGAHESSSIAEKTCCNPSTSIRGKRSNAKFTNTITLAQNTSSTVSTLVPGTIVRFRSQIPVDAKLIQGVPETDYFTHVQQVYYHFQKGEWRAVYGPSKNRQQKSFSVNKYGFYEAKRLAEEWRLRYLYSNPNGTNGQQNTAYNKCMNYGNGMAGNSGSCARHTCVKSGMDCVCKCNSNGICEDIRISGGNTRCRTGRKRRSPRIEVESEVHGGVIASLPGCLPTKVPNKGNGICNLKNASNYTPSKVGEVLGEVPSLPTGNHRKIINGDGVESGGGISKPIVGMESRSPRVVSQNENEEGGSRSREDSVYSSIDGMIAFGNAEFSATIPDQKPCPGKLSIISSQSPNSKSVLHPTISGADFVSLESGFKDSMTHKGLDISASSTASTTPSNTPGGLTGSCISLGGLTYDHVQKPFESDELLNNTSTYRGAGVSASTGGGIITSVSKLASSPSVGCMISSTNSKTTSSSTPMMISEISSPISSPVSVGTSSCSAIISPDKQKSMLGVGAGRSIISGLVRSVPDVSYSVASNSLRRGAAYSVQSALIGPGTSGNSSSSSSTSAPSSISSPQINGTSAKESTMLSQNTQGITIGFSAPENSYSEHFPTSAGILESSYGRISLVIEESCWNSSANNETMASSSTSNNSNLTNVISSNNTSNNNNTIGCKIPTSTSSSASNTTISSSSNIANIITNNVNSSIGGVNINANNGSKVPVLNNNDNMISVDTSQNNENLRIEGVLPSTVNGKDNTSCLSSSGTESVSASVDSSRRSIDENSSNHGENGCRSRNMNVNNNESNENSVNNGSTNVNNGENSDRRNCNSDVNRSNGNPWIKRNAWDEDFIIDSFFVG